MAFLGYTIGALYIMPISNQEGWLAVYQSQKIEGRDSPRPIYVIQPSARQKNVLLFASIGLTTLCCIGPAVTAGLLYGLGHYRAARICLSVRYTGWAVIIFSLGLIMAYYGVKFVLILRANILIAEALLKAPREAFGIHDLTSKSPSRYLFIMLLITISGGFFFAMGATILQVIFAVRREAILKSEDDGMANFIAFCWTCPLALAMLAKIALVGVQSYRNKMQQRSLQKRLSRSDHSLACTGFSDSKGSSTLVFRSDVGLCPVSRNEGQRLRAQALDQARSQKREYAILLRSRQWQ